MLNEAGTDVVGAQSHQNTVSRGQTGVTRSRAGPGAQATNALLDQRGVILTSGNC
jgi:hypothetical protein